VGIDAKLNTLEYGAYIARVLSGKHDSMVFGPYTPFLEPDGFLFFQYYPGESRNISIVNDPVVADMLVRQGRTLDPARRRQIIFDIQRYLAKQQYYIQMASAVYIAV
jgi:ABC-type transport system substrate-binding protein